MSGINDILSVIILSALPVTELRASIPIALYSYDLPVSQAVLFSVIGNSLPVALVFLFYPVFKRFFPKYLLHLEQKYADRYHKYGALFLFLFVAVPLPGSGVWTGSLLAVIFQMKPKYSVPAILLGMLLSGAIVLLISIYAGSV